MRIRYDKVLRRFCLLTMEHAGLSASFFHWKLKADAGVWFQCGVQQVWPVRNETKQFNLAGVRICRRATVLVFSEKPFKQRTVCAVKVYFATSFKWEITISFQRSFNYTASCSHIETWRQSQLTVSKVEQYPGPLWPACHKDTKHTTQHTQNCWHCGQFRDNN